MLKLRRRIELYKLQNNIEKLEQEPDIDFTEVTDKASVSESVSDASVLK